MLSGYGRPRSGCHILINQKRLPQPKVEVFFPALMQSFIFYFKSAHSALNPEQYRYLCSRLGPGCLAAHRRFRLGLLHS